jgi:mannose-1-phosphate guanylyltransferase
VKALILIGGFGTRLRPLTCTRPKALFPIVNKPLLEWTFERLAGDGVDEVVLAVNKLTEFHIKQQNLAKHGLKVKYSVDPPKMPLGTAGPIKKAQKLLNGKEPFFVLNGDLITEINFKEMLACHVEGQAVATIALHEAEDPSRYGVAELEKGNCIKQFIEKPPRGTEPTKLINAGVYVLSPKIFNYIPAGRAVSMEREIFPQLAQEKALYGHKVDGLWIDIGKPEEYLQTNKLLLQTCADKPRNSKYVCNSPVALAKGTKIGEGSIIGPCAILGENVVVGKNVQIQDSVIFANARIEDGAVIMGALIGEAAKIGKKAKVSDGCIVADHAKVKEGSVLFNVHVCPAEEAA